MTAKDTTYKEDGMHLISLYLKDVATTAGLIVWVASSLVFLVDIGITILIPANLIWLRQILAFVSGVIGGSSILTTARLIVRRNQTRIDAIYERIKTSAMLEIMAEINKKGENNGI